MIVCGMLLGILILFAQQVSAFTYVIGYDQNNVKRMVGAKNLYIEGSFYDVEFVNGTINSVFYNEKTTSYELAFQTQELAEKASDVLMNNVFINRGDDRWDDIMLHLPTGNPTVRTYYAFFYTPYNVGINTTSESIFLNYIPNYGTNVDNVDVTHTTSGFYDSNNSTSWQWARWTSSVEQYGSAINELAAVPIPSTLGLLGFGLLGLAGINRRKK